MAKHAISRPGSYRASPPPQASLGKVRSEPGRSQWRLVARVGLLVLSLGGYVLYQSYLLTVGYKPTTSDAGGAPSASGGQLMDTGVPAEFRGDWSRVDAARKGLASPSARPAAEADAAAVKDIEGLLAKSDAAKGLTAAAKTALAQEMLSLMAGIKTHATPAKDAAAGAPSAPGPAAGSRAQTTAMLAADAGKAAGAGTPSAPPPPPAVYRVGTRKGGTRMSAAESRKLVLPPVWLSVKAAQVHSFERPTTTTGVSWVGFYGLNDRQDVRAGDTYGLDYVLHGFVPMGAYFRKLALVVLCNGTDFMWDGSIPKATVIGFHSTLLIDLPLGTHRIKAGIYVQGFKEQAMWTEEYELVVRRVRYSRADLRSRVGNKPMALPADWVAPRAGDCVLSALCRVLKDWQTAAVAAGMTDFFLTSYTLLGHELWGWFMPWRGDHRWDRGAANPHPRFRMHYTPWKDKVYLGIEAEKYASAVETALKAQQEGSKARWKTSKSGTTSKGLVMTYEHIFGTKIILYLFHAGAPPVSSEADPPAQGVATKLQTLWAALSPSLGVGNVMVAGKGGIAGVGVEGEDKEHEKTHDGKDGKREKEAQKDAQDAKDSEGGVDKGDVGKGNMTSRGDKDVKRTKGDTGHELDTGHERVRNPENSVILTRDKIMHAAARRLLGTVQPEKAGRWRASGLDSEHGAVRHSAVQLVTAATLGGNFNVPKDIATHLLEAFGAGYEAIYDADKWEDHFEQCVGDLRQMTATPGGGREGGGRRGASVMLEEFGGAVQDVCWKLSAGGDAAWENPRLAGYSNPALTIGSTFGVFLCSSESAATRKGGHGGLPEEDGVIVLGEPRGAIVVVRNVECEAARRGFLNPGKQAGEMSEMIAAAFGPDEFVIDLAGPELLALRQEHVGACVYKFPFEVSLPGPFRLAAKLLRSNYTAVDEMNHSTSHPGMHFDDLMGSKTWLRFRPAASLGKRSVEDLIEGAGQKYCAPGTNAQRRGRWISRFGDGNGLFLRSGMVACAKAKNGERKPSFRAGGSGRLWHIDFTQLSWAPYECKERFFRPEEAAQCLSAKAILFTGDSHMRTFFNSVVKYSCGVPDAAQKGHHTSQCHTGQKDGGKCGGGVFCLEHNMLGWVDGLHLPERWDYIVANFGHHAAAGAEHWTLREYRAHVDAFLDAIQMRLQEQTKGGGHAPPHGDVTRFVWMASHAMPLARDNQIKTSGDWRTNQRLALYEHYAQERFFKMQKELGTARVMYQDAYNLTIPMIEAAAGDCGHFLPANIQMALVQQFLNLVCPPSEQP